MKRTLAFMGAALALGACATDPVTGQSIYGRTATGAGIGAVVGALGGVFAGFLAEVVDFSPGNEENLWRLAVQMMPMIEARRIAARSA